MSQRQRTYEHFQRLEIGVRLLPLVDFVCSRAKSQAKTNLANPHKNRTPLHPNAPDRTTDVPSLNEPGVNRSWMRIHMDLRKEQFWRSCGEFSTALELVYRQIVGSFSLPLNSRFVGGMVLLMLLTRDI